MIEVAETIIIDPEAVRRSIETTRERLASSDILIMSVAVGRRQVLTELGLWEPERRQTFGAGKDGQSND